MSIENDLLFVCQSFLHLTQNIDTKNTQIWKNSFQFPAKNSGFPLCILCIVCLCFVSGESSL